MTELQISQAYHHACMSELQALKPGNVHVFADGHGMTIHDFIKSADASAAVIAQPGLTIGERVFNAVEASRNAVGVNTNLGIILLCAPMIEAALNGQSNLTFQENLKSALNALSVQDASLTAQAIVLANPAGLGEVSKYDVHQQPNVTLLEMMTMAKERDFIASQYANNFSDVIEFGRLRYREGLAKWQHANNRGQNQTWATTGLYLSYLARQLDTHVVRKYGEPLAKQLMQEAREIEVSYWATENPKLMQKQLLAWDASLKQRKINPGTSADLTVATLLADFFE